MAKKHGRNAWTLTRLSNLPLPAELLLTAGQYQLLAQELVLSWSAPASSAVAHCWWPKVTRTTTLRRSWAQLSKVKQAQGRLATGTLSGKISPSAWHRNPRQGSSRTRRPQELLVTTNEMSSNTFHNNEKSLNTLSFQMKNEMWQHGKWFCCNTFTKLVTQHKRKIKPNQPPANQPSHVSKTSSPDPTLPFFFTRSIKGIAALGSELQTMVVVFVMS